MRTNIAIDDDLMRKAIKSTRLETKRAVVEAGLRLLIQVGPPTATTPPGIDKVADAGVPYWCQNGTTRRTSMATLNIKNVPDELYERLKSRAAENRRSINSEAIRRLEDALGSRPLDATELRASVRHLRELQKDITPLTQEMLDDFIDEGRP